MTDVQQRVAAEQFVKDWSGHGDEKQETQRFWIALLQNVFGVDQATNAIEFEVRVKLDHTSFIDGYIKDTNVLIEQKGANIDLTKGYKQSDGSMLTPFQQARRYAGYLPHNMNPRWIVVCNFKEFHIHDMNRPNDTPEIIKLEDLGKEYTRLQFLVDKRNERIQKEMEISLQAGNLVGKLYDALLKQYNTPASDAELKSLNMLCVRLVFCLYAEDAGIFGSHTMFHDYLKGFQTKNVRKALIDLFKVLNTKVADRDPYMDDELAAFPYVNGGLFADEEIIIPKFSEEIIDLLLTKASEDFNWSSISPTIFGAVFESTLNPETRRSGGMHYTSIENIHKVIDPLFYDELSAELDEIAAICVKKTRDNKLLDFQKKLASLTFLDPACGSGNFLTETYLSLRRLENKALMLRLGDQIIMGDSDEFNPIQVTIGQFYGIEINDFAVTVAKTALWIAESQMMKETEEIVHMPLEFLPLTSYANIVEGNALRLEWESVVPKDKLNYIMGNPPFVGKKEQTNSQKNDLKSLMSSHTKKVGILDYVSGWFFLATKMIKSNPKIRCAFVSTDSICQGEHVPALWKCLIDDNQMRIDFAHRTFKWNSETVNQAEVYCIVVGLSAADSPPYCKKIYTSGYPKTVSQINPYLLDAPTIWLQTRTTQINGQSKISYGSMPIDDGHLILSESDYLEFCKKEPSTIQHIKQYAGAEELLKGKVRYCLWLKGVSRKDILHSKMIAERVIKCKEFRESSARSATKKLAATPELFGEIRQHGGRMIVVPKVSSKHRRYIPLLIVDGNDYIINGSSLIIPDGDLFEFGVLSSNVHNAWLRAVAETWGHSYQYSTDIYNNFPFPTVTEVDRKRIEQTADNILAIRAKHLDLTIAEMYNPKLGIISDLLMAHQQNDKAVMQAYGFWGKLNTETECVAELMKMYQELTK